MTGTKKLPEVSLKGLRDGLREVGGGGVENGSSDGPGRSPVWRCGVVVAQCAA